MPRKLPEIVKEQQDSVLEIYLKETAKKGLNTVKLRKFLPPQVNQDAKKSVDEFFKLPLEEQREIANHLSRIADLQGKVRNSINSKFSTYLSVATPVDASSFVFAISKLSEAGVDKQNLQEILSQTIISNSITAHPTNPYSTEYSTESMELDRILAEENSEKKLAKLQEQIAKMIDLPPVANVEAKDKGKKTQADEVEEAMAYMQNLYHNLPIARRKMLSELSKFPEYNDLEIGNFYDMCVWLAGDGDGNTNATADSLQNNIDLFNKGIGRLYSSDLGQIIDSIKNQELKWEVLKIQGKIELNQYQNSQDLIKELKELKLPENNKQGLEDLIYRVENFGFRYAKIDVRHDASDINSTVADILIATGKLGEEDKKQFLSDLAGNNQGKISAHTTLIFEVLDGDLGTIDTSKFSETSKRIFDRLKVVAENPDCCDKLIIAECKNQANALGALLLLKATGNSIKKKGSLNIVTLSESADDLITLPENIGSLLENPTYRDHIIANGKLIYMIAKSDTQRRDGVGAQYTQELPPEEITKLFAEMVNKYPELKDVTIVPFNGGGHALQRGGGRIDEIPNIYNKAEMRGLNWTDKAEILALAHDIKIAPPIITTQGHQNGILFSEDNTDSFLISYYSQAIYALAKQKGFIKEPEVLNEDGTPNLFAKLARQNRKLYFEAAREVYKKEIATKDSPINILFRNGPWAGCDLCNVSSRPSKRKDTGGAPQLIDQRAIGAEKMCAHSGTHLISWYSANQGLQALMVQDGGFEQARLMYEHDKSTRDSFRSMAISLFMTNFDVAWEMMIGETRPEDKDIKSLAASYQPDHNIDPKITLAHIETEANETAKLLYKIISGKDKVDKNFKPQDLLKSFWSELASEVADREERLKFSHHLEAKLTSDLNKQGKQHPDENVEGNKIANLIRSIHSSCVGSEAPKGSMQTLTKIDKDKPRTGHEFEVPEELEKTFLVTGSAPIPSSQTKPTSFHQSGRKLYILYNDITN